MDAARQIQIIELLQSIDKNLKIIAKNYLQNEEDSEKSQYESLFINNRETPTRK